MLFKQNPLRDVLAAAAIFIGVLAMLFS